MTTRRTYLSAGLLLLASASCTSKTTTAAPAAPVAAPPTPAAAAAATGPTRIAPTTVVATWQGGQITYADVLEKAAKDLAALNRKQAQERFELEQNVANGIMVDRIVTAAASTAGQTTDQFIESVVAKVPAPSEDEINAFYAQRVAQSGQPLEAVKDRIIAQLGSESKRQAIQDEIEARKKALGAKVTLSPPPEALVTFDLANVPMKGKPDAPITVVEFSDFECPYCERAKDAASDLIKAYPDKVKVYFMHFPLSFHKQAMPTAVASECARQQGGFWPMHDALFAAGRGVTGETGRKHAEAAGLDLTKYDACVASPATRAKVEADMAQGEDAGVNGTPSFFINGVKFARGVPTPADLTPYL